MNREVPFDGSSVDDRIDERCDAFEAAWHNGAHPNIRDFIRSDDEPHRNKLFRELLLVDLEQRRALGEQPTPDDYLQMFPEFASEVDTVSLLHGATAFSTTSANGAGAPRAEPRRRGSRIGHFELVELLGTGAMGEAWKAWDTRVKRNVTLKLPHSSSLTENDLRRFLREVEAAGQLKHPQLAVVHSIEKDGDAFFIVAAFVEGRNLRDYASRKRLQNDEIVEICAQIGEVLQHAHDIGVVHRDLKAANIIIGPSGLPHIIDFGLAKILDAENDLTLNGELLGTPAYMSPELASGGAANADARTDVYSLGVILYELLSGRCPFTGNRGSVISQILACKPLPPRSLRAAIPRDLETICLKAIEKTTANRYATVADMAEDLRRFAAGLPIHARRAGILETSWRRVRRHPAVAASVLLMMAGVLGGIAMIASLQNRNKHLEGFRPVRITTTPSGAHVAIVPINLETNEPNSDPAGIVRPAAATPLTTELKPGTYLVEAVFSGSDGPEFVEVYRTVPDPNNMSESVVRRNNELGFESNTCLLRGITILPQRELIKNMVQIVIPDEARKQNHLLPAKLYVDANQITPEELKSHAAFKQLLSVTDKGEPCVTYPSAVRWAELNQTRLPSAAEYDLIVAAVERGGAEAIRTGERVEMNDLFDSYPEWSTTKANLGIGGSNRAIRQLRDSHMLKGYAPSGELTAAFPPGKDSILGDPETESAKISIRGVRSATPRFVKP